MSGLLSEKSMRVPFLPYKRFEFFFVRNRSEELNSLLLFSERAL